MAADPDLRSTISFNRLEALPSPSFVRTGLDDRDDRWWPIAPTELDRACLSHVLAVRQSEGELQLVGMPRQSARKPPSQQYRLVAERCWPLAIDVRGSIGVERECASEARPHYLPIKLSDGRLAEPAQQRCELLQQAFSDLALQVAALDALASVGALKPSTDPSKDGFHYIADDEAPAPALGRLVPVTTLGYAYRILGALSLADVRTDVLKARVRSQLEPLTMIQARFAPTPPAPVSMLFADEEKIQF